MPAVAAPETMNSPTALPSELNAVWRGPTATELVSASSTPGPGENVASSATPQNSSQVEKGMGSSGSGGQGWGSLGRGLQPHVEIGHPRSSWSRRCAAVFTATRTPVMTLKIIDRPAAVIVVGLQIRATPMSPDIPALWPRFIDRVAEIGHPLEERVTYGVMQAVADGGDRFDYLAGIAVTTADTLPDGMARVVLPAGLYAVFSYPLSGLAAGFGEIYERLLPGSGWVQRPGPYFERYGPDFCPDDPASLVEIYLPVSK
ncbi:transcriptional regulator, effector binding domain protein [Ostertagia ostertagi]